MSPVEADELWLRLVWFVRMRWLLPPALVLLGLAVNAWAGPIVPLFKTSSLLTLAWLTNVVYAIPLKRWRGEPAAHARQLRLLAHAQVLMDVVILNAAIYMTGGGASPLWPFSSLTLLAAGLFFPRTLDVVLYGAFTLAMFAVASLLHGRIEPSLLLLAALVTTVGFITVYFGNRMDELLRMRNEMRHKD